MQEGTSAELRQPQPEGSAQIGQHQPALSSGIDSSIEETKPDVAGMAVDSTNPYMLSTAEGHTAEGVQVRLKDGTSVNADQVYIDKSKIPRPYKCPLCDRAFYRLEQCVHAVQASQKKPLC